MKYKTLTELVKITAYRKETPIRELFSNSGITYDTYRNIVLKKHIPREQTIIDFCNLFNISEKEFKQMLKNI